VITNAYARYQRRNALATQRRADELVLEAQAARYSNVAMQKEIAAMQADVEGEKALAYELREEARKSQGMATAASTSTVVALQESEKQLAVADQQVAMLSHQIEMIKQQASSSEEKSKHQATTPAAEVSLAPAAPSNEEKPKPQASAPAAEEPLSPAPSSRETILPSGTQSIVDKCIEGMPDVCIKSCVNIFHFKQTE
jgi:hypothetical protein